MVELLSSSLSFVYFLPKVCKICFVSSHEKSVLLKLLCILPFGHNFSMFRGCFFGEFFVVSTKSMQDLHCFIPFNNKKKFSV